MGEPLVLPKIGSLDLSSVRNERTAEALSLQGDHELEMDGMIAESPRAATEQVLMTPRTAVGQPEGQGVLRSQCNSDPGQHGTSATCVASSGVLHASMGNNGQLFLWEADTGDAIA